jgi:hypothetical protein
MSDGGKGSKPRPFSVINEEYAKRWDAIFSRDLDTRPTPLPQTVSGGIEDYLKQSKEELKT